MTADTPRRAAALRLCGALKDLLSYAVDIGGVPAEYEVPLPVHAAVAEYQQTYPPPHLLPQPAQDHWTRLHRMIDGGRRRAGEFADAESEILYRQTVERLLAWAHDEARLNTDVPESDGWDRFRVFDDSSTVSLDGEGYTFANKEVFRLVRQLYLAGREDKMLTDKILVKELYPGENRDPRVIRHLKSQVTEPIKSCIKSRPHVGTWLQLPPRREPPR